MKTHLGVDVVEPINEVDQRTEARIVPPVTIDALPQARCRSLPLHASLHRELQ
jgi:hypothetical protein